MLSYIYKHLHLQYQLFFYDFNKTWFSRQILETKSANVKFHQNPSSGSRQTEGICCEVDTKHQAWDHKIPDPEEAGNKLPRNLDKWLLQHGPISREVLLYLCRVYNSLITKQTLVTAFCSY